MWVKMKINVKFVGLLTALTGCQSIIIEIGNNGKPEIFTLFKVLGEKFGKRFLDKVVDFGDEKPRPRILILKNEVEIHVLDGLNTKLDDGDTIVLIPYSHRG